MTDDEVEDEERSDNEAAAAVSSGPVDPNPERSTVTSDNTESTMSKEDRIKEEKLMAEWELKQGLEVGVPIEEE